MEKKLVVGGGSSLCEAIENMKNKSVKVLPSEKRCLFVVVDDSMSESENDETSSKDILGKYLFSGDSGGTIVFSTDVNSKKLSENPIKNRLIQLYKTYRNRFSAKKMLDKLRRKEDIYAWTIGRYLSGVYTGDNGKTFDENSISIDIIGVSREQLLKLCQELCKIFDQESVLLKDHKTNQIYFVRED